MCVRVPACLCVSLTLTNPLFHLSLSLSLSLRLYLRSYLVSLQAVQRVLRDHVFGLVVCLMDPHSTGRLSLTSTAASAGAGGASFGSEREGLLNVPTLDPAFCTDAGERDSRCLRLGLRTARRLLQHSRA